MAKHLETEAQKLRIEMDKKQEEKELADLRKEIQNKIMTEILQGTQGIIF